MKEVTITINGTRFDAVEFPYRDVSNKCESCDIFDHCFLRGKEEMRELCKVAGENCIYKFAKNSIMEKEKNSAV